tara:strand:- start:203 stop:382 length:180 start_codon:yes stop_codon:yes gene_type:complete
MPSAKEETPSPNRHTLSDRVMWKRPVQISGTCERIHDKIVASRKKGIWTRRGLMPLLAV